MPKKIILNKDTDMFNEREIHIKAVSRVHFTPPFSWGIMIVYSLNLAKGDISLSTEYIL